MESSQCPRVPPPHGDMETDPHHSSPHSQRSYVQFQVGGLTQAQVPTQAHSESRNEYPLACSFPACDTSAGGSKCTNHAHLSTSTVQPSSLHAGSVHAGSAHAGSAQAGSGWNTETIHSYSSAGIDISDSRMPCQKPILPQDRCALSPKSCTRSPPLLEQQHTAVAQQYQQQQQEQQYTAVAQQYQHQQQEQQHTAVQQQYEQQQHTAVAQQYQQQQQEIRNSLVYKPLDPQTALPPTQPLRTRSSSPLPKLTNPVRNNPPEGTLGEDGVTRLPSSEALAPTQYVGPPHGAFRGARQAARALQLPHAHNYEQINLIGNGAYGTVYLGRDLSERGRYVALKKIKITLTDDGMPVSAVREISLLKQLETFKHPNVVRLLDICHGRLERENRLNLVLVFEYVEMDLDTYLKKVPSPGLEPRRIRLLMHQILSGVDFLHSNRIIHRDLKPQNILVDRNDKVKIADFGLARIYDYNMKLTTMVVTLWYRAPEVLLSNSYATPVDIWSCACIFAELFRKRPLFEGHTEGDQLQRIFEVIGTPSERDWPSDVSLCISSFRGNRPKPLPDVVPELTSDAADLMQRMLTFVPDSRASARQSLRHSYFNEVSQDLAIPGHSSTSSSILPTSSSIPPTQLTIPSTDSSVPVIASSTQSTQMSVQSTALPTQSTSSSITPTSMTSASGVSSMICDDEPAINSPDYRTDPSGNSGAHPSGDSRADPSGDSRTDPSGDSRTNPSVGSSAQVSAAVTDNDENNPNRSNVLNDPNSALNKTVLVPSTLAALPSASTSLPLQSTVTSSTAGSTREGYSN